MPQLSDRVHTFTDSVIRRMTRIANKHNAINLSQGFPDFDPPLAIREALSRAAMAGPHQYSITFGAENFRRALAEKHRKFSGCEVNPDTDIVVTCGGTEAMMTAMMTVCNPGDKVVIFSPYYENYSVDAIISGAKPVFVPLTPPEFAFDPAVLENAFRQKPKAIVVCNPSNPCGKVFTPAELKLIADLAVKYDAFILTDEVYEHIVFAPNKHTYMASLPGIADRVLCTSSLSKTYSMTGWRLGYIIGPANVIEHSRKVHDFLTVGAPAPLQEAAVTGLNLPGTYYDDLAALYRKKRDCLVNGLRDLGFSTTLPQGTYFVMADIGKYLARDCFKGWTDLQFCEWLCAAVGVAAVPGSTYFHEPVNHLMRLHFARGENVLEQALERLGGLDAAIERFSRG